MEENEFNILRKYWKDKVLHSFYDLIGKTVINYTSEITGCSAIITNDGVFIFREDKEYGIMTYNRPYVEEVYKLKLISEPVYIKINEEIIKEQQQQEKQAELIEFKRLKDKYENNRIS